MSTSKLAFELLFLSLFITTKGSEDISITCNKYDITVSILKTFIPDFYLEDLSTLDSKCDFQRSANYTHFTVVIPLVGCGTVSRHTNTTVIYSNMVKNKPFDSSAVINRLPVLEIPVRCSYPKKVAASYKDFSVGETLLELKVEDGSGEFDLQMGLFRDSTFVDQYEDFPVTVPLNQRLYFQLNVDSADKSLSISADTCYATPRRIPSSEDRYVIIEQRCPKDSTFETHPSPPWAQRFSFQAFQFVYSNEVPYVFIHCEVRLCNATDKDSSCTTGCSDISTDVKLRLKRETTEETYSLEQGPIVILSEIHRPQPDELKHKDSRISTPHVVLIGMGFICLLCLLVVIFTRRQLLKIRAGDVVRTTRL